MSPDAFALPPLPEARITFAGGLRDRADRLRGNPLLLRRFQADPAARVLPMWRGKPLIDFTESPARLGWLPLDHPLMDHAAEAPVFLGLEGEDRDTCARFAADVSAWIDPAQPEGPPPGFFDPTRSTPPEVPDTWAFSELRGAMAELSCQDAADAATARGVLEWHRTHLFCSRCGHPSDIAWAGWRRKCPACGAEHYPRTDPVVIMLVTRGGRTLVGRQRPWPRGMYSLLAGFMEPGETMEAAVRREVLEEAGISVGRVRYLASQPWPFPASLMIACAAEALSDEITLDDAELEDACWITRDEVRAAAEGSHPRLAAARPGAIARSVLDAWAAGYVPDWD